MSHGRAYRAKPSKKISSGITSGASGQVAAGVTGSIDMAGVVTALDTINTTLRSTSTDSDTYIPDFLVRNLTVLSSEVLYIDKPERVNNLTNGGQVIITPTGVLVVLGNLANSGTILIHNGGRLVT